jgi:(2Fe-2S) ferredoxin
VSFAHLFATLLLPPKYKVKLTMNPPSTRPKSAVSETPYYEHHVFFCLNVRQAVAGEAVRQCCGGEAANSAQQHAKLRIKRLNLNQAGKVRINQAGCLERCEQGPCLVVYPEGVWYSYVDTHDIDAIIDEHIVGGKRVKRLEIPAPNAFVTSTIVG